MNLNKKQIVAIVAALLVVGGIGFYAGSWHRSGDQAGGKDKFQEMRGNFRGNPDNFGQGMGMQNGNPGMMQGGGPANNGLQNGNGQNGPQNGMGPGNCPAAAQAGMTGKITEKNDKTLTVELSDGTTKTVTYADSTAITKEDSASDSDLSVGTQVTVNPDNSSIGSDSIVAQSIQIQTAK